MNIIHRTIGGQTIIFDRDDNAIFVTFPSPEGMPEDTFRISFNNKTDALTGYWVCCNTASDMKAEDESLVGS